MAYKVFLDTNIFLDHFLSGNEHSSILLEHCELGNLEGFASSVSFYTLAYILSKNFSTEKAKSILSKYLRFIVVISISIKDLNLVLSSKFNNLEDGFQYSTALKEPAIKFFVTNNIKDFKTGTSTLSVISPKDFLQRNKF